MPPKSCKAVKDGAADLVGSIMASMSASSNSSDIDNQTVKHLSVEGIGDSDHIFPSTSVSTEQPAEEDKAKNSNTHSERKAANKSTSSQVSKSRPGTSKSPSAASSDMDFIKQSLVALTATVNSLVPTVGELKAAYDNHCQDSQEAGSSEVVTYDDDTRQEEGQLSDAEDACPTPLKQPKLDCLIKLDGNAKKAENLGPRVNDQLSGLVSKLLTHGMDKEAKSNIMQRYLRPQNCERLEPVRVNAEIFKTVQKNIKQDDFRKQRIQKTIRCGVTAVVNLLDSHINAANDEGELPSAADSMGVLSVAISLFADAMYEMDLRRRAAFRHEIRDEYKSL